MASIGGNLLIEKYDRPGCPVVLVVTGHGSVLDVAKAYVLGQIDTFARQCMKRRQQ
jgi:hypothetical protein